jgi:hypothetical protein
MGSHMLNESEYGVSRVKLSGPSGGDNPGITNA